MSGQAGQSRGARVSRGLGMAGSSVVVAAFSHVAGGGAQPGALGAGLAFAFAALVCIGLAGRRLSALRATVAVALSQFVFHVLFSLGAALPSAHGHSVSMVGMVMSGGASTSLPDLARPGVAAAFDASGALMWAAHGVAAVATIVLLLHGERGLFAIVRLATERLRVLVSSVDAVLARAHTLSRHRVSAAIADLAGVRPLDALLSTRPHRGPPRVA